MRPSKSPGQSNSCWCTHSIGVSICRAGPCGACTAFIIMDKTVGVALPRGLVISLSTGSPIGSLFCVSEGSSSNDYLSSVCSCWPALILRESAPLDRCISVRDCSMYSQATLSWLEPASVWVLRGLVLWFGSFWRGVLLVIRRSEKGCLGSQEVRLFPASQI